MSIEMRSVAEAIMDMAAREYVAENLASIEAVRAYADAAMNTDLTSREAAVIRRECRAILRRIDEGEIPSTAEWDRFYEALEDYEDLPPAPEEFFQI